MARQKFSLLAIAHDRENGRHDWAHYPCASFPWVKHQRAKFSRMKSEQLILFSNHLPAPPKKLIPNCAWLLVLDRFKFIIIARKMPQIFKCLIFFGYSRSWNEAATQVILSSNFFLQVTIFADPMVGVLDSLTNPNNKSFIPVSGNTVASEIIHNVWNVRCEKFAGILWFFYCDCKVTWSVC